jgi:hypothetical protein
MQDRLFKQRNTVHNLVEISHIVVSGFSTGALLYLLSSSLQFIVITKRADLFLRC